MDGIRQHKQMATGDKVMAQDSNFGVENFANVNGGSAHPDAGMSHRPMKDGSRGIGRHVDRGEGRMPAQSHPDHGPHQCDFGVGPIPR